MDFTHFPYLGECSALAASLIWSCSVTIYRAWGQELPAQTLNLFKLLVALIGYTGLIAVLYATGCPPTWPTTWEKIGWLTVSGVIGFTIGDTFFFASISRLGAQLSSAIQCLTPPITALINWLYLETALSFPQMIGLTITVFAVMAVILAGSPVTGLRVGSRGWWYGLLFAVLSAIFNAISYSMMGHLFKNENLFCCLTIRIAPALLLLVIPAMFTPLGRSGVRLMLVWPKRLAYLTLAAFLGTVVGMTFLSLAFQHTSSEIVSTLATTYPVWVIPVASFFLKEHPKPIQILGTILAVVGVALLAIPQELYAIWQWLASELWLH
jgi:drug/metabolite transporter (DMT)-like permease